MRSHILRLCIATFLSARNLIQRCEVLRVQLLSADGTVCVCAWFHTTYSQIFNLQRNTYDHKQQSFLLLQVTGQHGDTWQDTWRHQTLVTAWEWQFQQTWTVVYVAICSGDSKRVESLTSSQHQHCSSSIWYSHILCPAASLWLAVYIWVNIRTQTWLSFTCLELRGAWWNKVHVLHHVSVSGVTSTTEVCSLTH